MNEWNERTSEQLDENFSIKLSSLPLEQQKFIMPSHKKQQASKQALLT